MLKVPWSASFMCLADSAHSASRLYWDKKTQQVRAYDELPLEIRLIVSMMVTSVLWYFILRRLCIAEIYSWQESITWAAELLLQHLAWVLRGRRWNWLWALSQCRTCGPFAFQMLLLWLERCCCCPKTRSSILLYWTVRSILIPGQGGSLGSIPTAHPLHTYVSGALVGLPGVPAILLAVLISPRAGFKCTSANISNVDRAISFKGQHWSLLYTPYRGYLC